jgi:DNA-binding response OmpR family regulator
MEKKKIVIVEDELMLAEMYRDKLLRVGFDVYSAFDAEEGLELVRKVKPDLILLDILLPRENGVGLLGRIRKEPEIGSTPVIAFSNYDDTQTKNEAKELGAKEYLIKTNYTPQEIVDKIKEHLN